MARPPVVYNLKKGARPGAAPPTLLKEAEGPLAWSPTLLKEAGGPRAPEAGRQVTWQAWRPWRAILPLGPGESAGRRFVDWFRAAASLHLRYQAIGVGVQQFGGLTGLTLESSLTT